MISDILLQATIKPYVIVATTEVYWASIVAGEKNLLVTCHFNKYSKAKGCFVDIKLLTDFTLEEGHKIFSISRLHDSHVASLCVQIPSQSYVESVVVKDWKESGRTGSVSVTTFTDRRENSPCESRATCPLTLQTQFCST